MDRSGDQSEGGHGRVATALQQEAAGRERKDQRSQKEHGLHAEENIRPRLSTRRLGHLKAYLYRSAG